MAKVDSQKGLRPSILDRLIDPESGGTDWRHGYGVEQMYQAILRDLGDLLNTRQSAPGLAPEYEETCKSILAYGLPDFSGMSPEQQSDVLARNLQQVVEQFEPRLKDVQVHRSEASDSPETKSRSVRFRIEARLNVEPAPPVAYETILELTTRRYSVEPRAT
jgi:type VI secretion system protein ImpF